MDSLLEEIFKDKSDNEMANVIVNLNKFQLNRKEHIKKYNKLRKLHSEIIDNMLDYIYSGKYNISEKFKSIEEYIDKETKGLEFSLKHNNYDDSTILTELFIYKNHNKLKPLIELYLEKNKFKNKEKVKMLECMKNSYVGLFKVINSNYSDGYITYEDVFTHKKIKVIDISMSSTLKIDKKRTIYVYNRIITYDDISFGTGIHCIMDSDNKELIKFIKTHKYNSISHFSRCLLLYDIYKRNNNLSISYNNQYGYRR